MRPRGAPPELVAESASMRAIMEAAHHLAHVRDPLLIVGETGVGKEFLARAIHARGPGAERPFAVVRCDALVPGDVERAAESAGTILIRGLSDASREQQAALLRALDRIGGGEGEPRLVAALNREPAALERGTTAEELFYRLACHELAIPPLRRRPEDVLPLAALFLERAKVATGRPLDGFTPEAASILQGYAWPGNVRELESCVARAVLAATGDTIDRRNLSFPGGARQAHDPTLVEIDAENLRDARTRFERAHVERILAKYTGDKQRAAEALGIDLSSLYRKLDLKKNRSREDEGPE